MAQSLSLKSMERSESRTALFMMLPAAGLLLLFLIVPFFMAFYLSLTNQRLISPEPAQFVGIDNYRQLLRLELIRMEPETDEATGEPLRDDTGALQYPRAREILRGNETYDGLREMSQFDLLGTRYLLAAGDERFWRALINTFYFAAVIVPVQTAFALLLAILVNQKLRGTVVYRAIYFSPVVTTMAVIAVVWFFLYNPDQGLINATLRFLGVQSPPRWLENPLSAMPAIMLLSIWQGAGFQMVIFLAGLQEIPDVLYEAARIDGANRWQQFRFVTLPSLRNTTIFVVISSTILAFKLFTQVHIMTFGQGGPEDSTVTIMLHLISQGFNEQRVGYASTIAVIFVVLVLAISLIQRRVLRGENT
jgi:multiple sugar transport system permease protein